MRIQYSICTLAQENLSHLFIFENTFLTHSLQNLSRNSSPSKTLRSCQRETFDSHITALCIWAKFKFYCCDDYHFIMSNPQAGKTWCQQDKQQREANTPALQKEPLFPSRKAWDELEASADSLADWEARAWQRVALLTLQWTGLLHSTLFCKPNVLLFHQQTSMDLIK